MTPRTLLITGGAGFIGSAVIRRLIRETDCRIINVDKLTYAGNLDSLAEVATSPRYQFIKLDICDRHVLRQVFENHRPDAVMHLAAESHVDRSIDAPAQFIQTNLVGTFCLLEAARLFWSTLDSDGRHGFRFHHISTDEVFGSLGEADFFIETTAYAPNSPYSASKAGADHLARAWHHTYKLPVVVSNCSNNYGPYQFPEKFIPHMIINALLGKPLPIYGDGMQVRDWLFVNDHVSALMMILERGTVGQTYNVGGCGQRTNLEMANMICALLDEMLPDSPHCPHERLIHFVHDRPGHDRRYAIDATKVRNDIGWTAVESLETGMRKTVQWYLDNSSWWQRALDGSYRLARQGVA